MNHIHSLILSLIFCVRYSRWVMRGRRRCPKYDRVDTAAQVDSATVEMNRDTRDAVDAERSVDFV